MTPILHKKNFKGLFYRLKGLGRVCYTLIYKAKAMDIDKDKDMVKVFFSIFALWMKIN